MDIRRTRTRPKDSKESKKPEGKKNSLRSSPSRRASPTRRGSPPPTRKSPSRRASPGRKASPSRRASPPQRPASTTSTRSSRQRSAAVVTPTPVVVPPSPIKEKKEPIASPKTKSEKTNTTLSVNEKIVKSASTTTTTTASSVHSSFSISTHKTTDIGTTKDTSGDSEVAKLTDYIRRSVSKAFSTSRRGGSQTPSTHPSQISRSVSQSVYDDGDNYSKMEFSDSEEENFKSVNITTKSSYTPLLEKSSSICRKLEVPKEYGGLIGASLLLLIVPLLAYYLPWCCRKTACEFKKPNLTALWDLKYLERVFSGRGVGSYVTFTSGVFVLSAALFGRFVRLPSDRIGSGYHFNALPIAILAIIGVGVGEYLKYPVADFILKNYLRYCLYSLLNALLVATWCYIRSKYIAGQDLQLNPYAKSGNFIVDFSLGRQVNPKWFGRVDIKQVYYKISLIFTLLLAGLYCYKNIQVQVPKDSSPPVEEAVSRIENLLLLAKSVKENVKFDTVSLLTSWMLLTYASDGIIFEHHLASSFELQQEGVGALLLLRYAATPFLLSAVPRFFFEHKPTTVVPNWALISMVVLFLIGLALKRISNRIKYMYRINPNLRTFIGVETVHTFQGRRLLLGKLWGRVRQPNYAGEILTLMSFAVPLCFKFAWPPLVSVLLLVAFLLHRAVRVSARNSTRYHSSWVRYCMKVRYLVVPKVF